MKKVLMVVIAFALVAVPLTGCLGDDSTASLQEIAITESDLPEGWEFLVDFYYNQTEVGPEFVMEDGVDAYIKYFKYGNSTRIVIQLLRFETPDAASSHFNKYHDELANSTYQQIISDDVNIGDECFLLDDGGSVGYILRVGNILAGVGFEEPPIGALDEATLENLAEIQASRMA
ncbi:MAG: hypothetical protein GKC03_07020 [Methanomassiliicoccales archaeon]|nr:hypothetical protein [Methanomassiliicoccales archaeon]